MLESWLLQEWASILSECVSVKFHQIDFFTNRDIAKNIYFSANISVERERERERAEA